MESRCCLLKSNGKYPSTGALSVGRGISLLPCTRRAAAGRVGSRVFVVAACGRIAGI